MAVTLQQDAPLIKEGKRSISYRNYIAGKWSYFLVKRVIDMVLSVFIVLGVFSWLLPLLALLVKLDSRGPVFFYSGEWVKVGVHLPVINSVRW
ncbi:hypothetical protein [Paraflavitalea speifideaquila]|uniref:hypothetical protein n=1 Tax=Paraflavitalea speifideaquila TaxID=3076558 RepID=UPI0028E8201E|nr:hypothetical protein [Paraflavitalea speifideiaquila]